MEQIYVGGGGRVGCKLYTRFLLLSLSPCNSKASLTGTSFGSKFRKKHYSQFSSSLKKVSNQILACALHLKDF